MRYPEQRVKQQKSLSEQKDNKKKILSFVSTVRYPEQIESILIRGPSSSTAEERMSLQGNRWLYLKVPNRIDFSRRLDPKPMTSSWTSDMSNDLSLKRLSNAFQREVLTPLRRSPKEVKVRPKNRVVTSQLPMDRFARVTHQSIETDE
ncbi:hypothetical protein NPIL_304291 [Nephila pilipes]|uniref:Uncharacterized protein n=1 Tax=Nephila pilipes TaxID=299642 RepID=A0A8X6UG70_NEPPI|nr:hypothetical protein NPIL_304291 [Nephila pilipes]